MSPDALHHDEAPRYDLNDPDTITHEVYAALSEEERREFHRLQGERIRGYVRRAIYGRGHVDPLTGYYVPGPEDVMSLR